MGRGKFVRLKAIVSFFFFLFQGREARTYRSTFRHLGNSISRVETSFHSSRRFPSPRWRGRKRNRGIIHARAIIFFLFFTPFFSILATLLSLSLSLGEPS